MMIQDWYYIIFGQNLKVKDPDVLGFRPFTALYVYKINVFVAIGHMYITVMYQVLITNNSSL